MATPMFSRFLYTLVKYYLAWSSSLKYNHRHFTMTSIASLKFFSANLEYIEKRYRIFGKPRLVIATGPESVSECESHAIFIISFELAGTLYKGDHRRAVGLCSTPSVSEQKGCFILPHLLQCSRFLQQARASEP